LPAEKPASDDMLKVPIRPGRLGDAERMFHPRIVRRSQPIAEMGASDADRVKLHFEVRRMGKPVDPVQLLPVRP
jgi:hypothetical protein